jgi:biopolymer transport protein ExbD
MAEVNTGDSGGGHGKHQKKRAKKQSTRIDMTPMVDLAFLLLTFFVMTSTFNKAKTLEILYPADPKDQQRPPKISNALTFVLVATIKYFIILANFILWGM